MAKKHKDNETTKETQNGKTSEPVVSRRQLLLRNVV